MIRPRRPLNYRCFEPAPDLRALNKLGTSRNHSNRFNLVPTSPCGLRGVQPSVAFNGNQSITSDDRTPIMESAAVHGADAARRTVIPQRADSATKFVELPLAAVMRLAGRQRTPSQKSMTISISIMAPVILSIAPAKKRDQMRGPSPRPAGVKFHAGNPAPTFVMKCPSPIMIREPTPRLS
jgi:hypothetical protein